MLHNGVLSHGVSCGGAHFGGSVCDGVLIGFGGVSDGVVRVAVFVGGFARAMRGGVGGDLLAVVKISVVYFGVVVGC